MKFQFEQTPYGWDCYAKQGSDYRYFGHFLTKSEAEETFAHELQHGAEGIEQPVFYIHETI